MKKKKWEPKDGDKFYSIEINFKKKTIRIVKNIYGDRFAVDKYLIPIGNCFETRMEAYESFENVVNAYNKF